MKVYLILSDCVSLCRTLSPYRHLLVILDMIGHRTPSPEKGIHPCSIMLRICHGISLKRQGRPVARILL